MIKAIIFDFDGVILESVSVKTHAFGELFSFTPGHVDEIVHFHLQNGGMSRFDKFRYIYANILHEKLTNAQMEKLSNQFSELVFVGVNAAPFVTGVQEFLEKNHSRFQLFIVSATPEHELKDIVNNRGISHFFDGVYGSPTQKREIFGNICRKFNLSCGEVLFIGDSINDWKAVAGTGIRFVGRVKSGDPAIFSQLPSVEGVISDISGLEEIICELP